MLARTGGWFKPARLKLAAASNGATDSLLSPRHAHQRAVYCPAQLATKFRGCPKLGLKAVSHSVLCCALFLGSLAVIQAPPASRVGAGNMIMEASVEMEKGVVVAQQPVVT